MLEMYNRQVKFQERMNTNYEIQYLALVAEIGELVDSFGFADWKVNERDDENILIECMDICIFAMNCNHYLNGLYMSPTIEYVSGTYTDYQLIEKILENLYSQQFMNILELIFDAYPEVKVRLIGKQALNTFRQNNGYKEGTYSKIWANGKEDNITMLNVLKPKDTFDDIYKKLEAQYKCIR